MQIGNIAKLVAGKECGLIRSRAGDEVHFHKQCLWDICFGDLQEGQEIEYEVQLTRSGYLGFHIRPYVK